MRSKHGQHAKESVIRESQCVGREVSKAVNTSEECIKSATVNIAAPLVELVSKTHPIHFKFKCTQAVC